MLSRLVITFLPRSKCLLISWLQLPSAVILEPPKIKSAAVSTVSPSICHEVMGPGEGHGPILCPSPPGWARSACVREMQIKTTKRCWVDRTFLRQGSSAQHPHPPVPTSPDCRQIHSTTGEGVPETCISLA